MRFRPLTHRFDMKTAAALCLSILLSSFATAATLDDDVAHYAQIAADTSASHAKELDALAWQGISDPKVFDIIEARLLAGLTPGAAAGSNDEIEARVRALGFSGQPKYVPTLNKFLDDRHFSRPAKMAIEDISSYQKWNPVISNRATFDAKYSDEVNRILNMLHADDFMLKRVGAKRVYFENKDQVLLDTLESQIRASYLTVDSKNDDAVAWMIKALGSTKQVKYQALYEEVASKSTNRVVSAHSKKALALLGK